MALRFGVLGTGYWAQEAHATALAAHPGTELVGVWGRDPAKTEAFAARFGIRGHADLERLLAEVDAVAIAVPPDVQAELALAAAAAGRHLLLDKPLALSADAADRVAAAAAERELATLVFFTLRFLPEVAAWMEEVTAAGAWQGGGGAWMGSVFTEPGSPFAASPWRRRKGALWDLGPHMLALALPLFGPVESVTAATLPPEAVNLILHHQGGARSSLTLSQSVPPSAAAIRFQLQGAERRSVLPPFTLDHLVALEAAVGQLVAMVDAGDTSHPCDVRLGRDTVAVLEIAERFLTDASSSNR